MTYFSELVLSINNEHAWRVCGGIIGNTNLYYDEHLKWYLFGEKG